MLENYFSSGSIKTSPEKQRLIAVQAALEIIKESLSATSANTNATRVNDCLKAASENIIPLADAIQAAINTK